MALDDVMMTQQACWCELQVDQPGMFSGVLTAATPVDCHNPQLVFLDDAMSRECKGDGCFIHFCVLWVVIRCVVCYAHHVDTIC